MQDSLSRIYLFFDRGITCACAGEHSIGYTALREDLALEESTAEQVLAEKRKRLRELPALIRAARWEEWRRNSHDDFLFYSAKCKQLGIGAFLASFF